jgi:hypothetical protein
MPTSKLDLMELFEATIMAAQTDGAKRQRPRQNQATRSTYFDTPAAEVGASSTTLVELLGDQPDLLLALAASYESASGKVTGLIIREIATFLSDPSVNLDITEYRTRRFLDYVYPVV